MKAFSSPKRRKGLIPWYHSSSYEFSYALIASVTGSPASAYVVLTINVRPVQQKNSEASWEITLAALHHPAVLCKTVGSYYSSSSFLQYSYLLYEEC